MSYLLFDANPERRFDDGEGGEGTLGQHLDYIGSFGGSPDCWDCVDTDNRHKAIQVARESGLHLYVVDDLNYRVVGEVNRPE